LFANVLTCSRRKASGWASSILWATLIANLIQMIQFDKHWKQHETFRQGAAWVTLLRLSCLPPRLPWALNGWHGGPAPYRFTFFLQQPGWTTLASWLIIIDGGHWRQRQWWPRLSISKYSWSRHLACESGWFVSGACCRVQTHNGAVKVTWLSWVSCGAMGHQHLN